jgi:hypothetical protein
MKEATEVIQEVIHLRYKDSVASHRIFQVKTEEMLEI